MLCTLSKYILSCVIAITVKVMGLEEPCPEFCLCHLVRNILQVFLFHSRICFEDGLNYIFIQIILQSIATICLWFYIRLKTHEEIMNWKIPPRRGL